MAKKIDNRSKIWNVIFYPDSAPDYWEDIIKDTHVSCAVSPLHNMDRWTAKDEAENPLHKKGETKKPHYHLHIHYDGNKTQEQVFRDFCVPLNTKLNPVISNSDRNDTRYLIHLDNDDKAPYRMDEIRFFNGFDFKDYFEMSENEEFDMGNLIDNWIYEQKICEYSILRNRLYELDYKPWLRYVKGHLRHYELLLKSYRHNGFEKFNPELNNHD